MLTYESHYGTMSGCPTTLPFQDGMSTYVHMNIMPWPCAMVLYHDDMGMCVHMQSVPQSLAITEGHVTHIASS